MKLTGKLKEKVEQTETKEQAKELIADAGMELTDEEVDQVSGGDGQSYVGFSDDMSTILQRI